MIYKFCITETLERIVEMEGEDEQDAYDKVCDAYRNAEIVLDADDYIDNEIKWVPDVDA